MLKGNHDNHTYSKHNKRRWNSYKSSLLKFGKKKLTIEDIKSLVTNKKGEIYNNGTRQIILFEPETLSLSVFFRSSRVKSTPVFKKIDLKLRI